MMNPDELKGLNDTEVKSPEEKKYLPSGLHRVKLTEYEFIEPDGNKCPYLQVMVEDEKGYSAKFKFWRERPGDSEDSITFKRTQMKKFFVACGADFSRTKPEEFMKSALNNYFNCVLRDEEYIGYDKDNNNKPKIKTIVTHSFSQPLLNEDGIEVSITLKDSYTYKELNDEQRKKYKFELKEWDSKQGNASSQEKEEDDDDLPF